MGNKLIRKVLTMFIIFIGVFCATACFSPKQFIVNVKFLSVDDELVSIRSYQRGVEYGQDHEVTFKVPEGFDSSSITAKLVVGNKSADLEVETRYKDSMIDSYKYATEKEITIKLNRITANCAIEIDMAGVSRKVCELKFNGNTAFERFTAVAIDPSELTQLIVLDDSKILKEYSQVTTNRLDIDYGDYVALIYNKDYTQPEIDTIYSRENYFTETSHKANIGRIHYSFYDKSVRGNVAYTYNNNSNTRIFYLGEVRESMEFFSSIPEYQESKGFTDIEDVPNTVALLTNFSKYNSDLLTTTLYKKTNKIYSASDSSLDMITSTGTVLEKASPVEQKYNRYDLYRVYVGDNYSAETHWTTEQKAGIIEELYISIESDMDLSYFKGYLLERENQSTNGAVTLDFNLSSSRGKTFVKLTTELLQSFILDRSYEDSTTSYDYRAGMSILYIKPTDEMLDLRETVAVLDGKTGQTYDVNRRVFTTVTMMYDFISSIKQSIYDYELNVYAKNDGVIDHGIVDYHDRYLSDGAPVVYIRTSNILNTNNDYKDSLFLHLVGPEIKDFSSTRISRVHIKNDGDKVNKTDSPIVIEEDSEVNGLVDTQIGSSEFISREIFDGFLFKFNITMLGNRTEAYQVDFTHMNLPKNSNQGIYVSNDVDFDELTDFDLVNYLSAAKTSDDVSDNMEIVSFGYYRDIYFITVSDVEIPFNIYLDPDDPNSKVSITRPLYDIVGNPLTIDVGGEQREVRVMYLDIIYEIYKKSGDYRFFAG